jgi:voltage-gated potassium channel Kch
MDKPSMGERLRYWFDGVMSRGVVALMGLLGVATVAFIAAVSLIVFVFGLFPQPDGQTEELSFGETLWSSLLRTLDAGTMGGDQGIGFRVAMLTVTIGGVILVAGLISIISGAFDSRVEDLRKGRSRVLETDHTLILGWSSKVFPILNEICLANESRGKAAVVILAEGDKVRMEDEIRGKVIAPKRTRIIVRSGDPMDLRDLEVASPHRARSVIILAPETSSDPDSVAIKTALALTNNPRRKAGKYHIVGEIQEGSNLEAARLVGKEEADWVLSKNLISRMIVQTSRQSGLSVVYTELLDFAGDEIYFCEQPDLVGNRYAEVAAAFETSSLIGIVTEDDVLLNPPVETVYCAGNKLIFIAEDDSTIAVGPPGVVDESVISSRPSRERGPEQALVLGYNSGLHMMLRELDEYVASGSRVSVVADVDAPTFATYNNLIVDFTRGDSASRSVLNTLGVQDFEHIIVLSYQGLLEPQAADAKTLITLLQLRDMAEVLDIDLQIVSEMLDDRNREIAEVTQADDFIVSDKLISLLLCQISENDRLWEVFEALFSSRGSQIYLRPASDYIIAGSTANFYTVMHAAGEREETAIGHRIAKYSRSRENGYGITVNPSKSTYQMYSSADQIIVLGEGGP